MQWMVWEWQGVEDRGWLVSPSPIPSKCLTGPEVPRMGQTGSVQRRPPHSPVKGLHLVLEMQKTKTSKRLVFPQAVTELYN